MLHMNIIENNNDMIAIFKKNDKVFEFYKDTVLDNIYYDLWTEIMKYYTIPSFAFGKPNENYPGYHSLTLEEFYMHKEDIINHYNKNKTLYSFDNQCNETWLTINGHHLQTYNKSLYINVIEDNKATICIDESCHLTYCKKLDNLDTHSSKSKWCNISVLFIRDL